MSGTGWEAVMDASRRSSQTISRGAFSIEKCHFVNTVHGRKEIIISEECVVKGFQCQVSCHSSAYCKSRDLV